MINAYEAKQISDIESAIQTEIFINDIYNNILMSISCGLTKCFYIIPKEKIELFKLIVNSIIKKLTAHDYYVTFNADTNSLLISWDNKE